MSKEDPIDAVFLNGTVGAGKSTIAEAISAAETVPHAVVDLDAFRRLVPSPSGDPFGHEVELQNLRSVAENYRAAGARRFILAGVIEAGSEVARYREALNSSGLLVIRLIAEPAELDRRLRERHKNDEDELAWHLNRVGELFAILEEANIDDLVLDSTHRPPSELAEIIRSAAGWRDDSGGLTDRIGAAS